MGRSRTYQQYKAVRRKKPLYSPTHYHELTELEGTIAGVKNYCIAVKEQGDDIVFLRKIVRGGADKSYGIQVAKLAGVPDSVISRAKEIASELTENDITAKAKEIASVSANVVQHKAVPKPDEVDMQQMSFFDTVKMMISSKSWTDWNCLP